MQQYLARTSKTIIELQPFRKTEQQIVADAKGRQGVATLIDLNPRIHAWYLLALKWNGDKERYYHLENSAPHTQTFALDAETPGSLTIIDNSGARSACDLWSSSALESAAARPIPYAPLCEGRLYLHNAVRGHISNFEAVVDFLRNHVWAGEELLSVAKETVLRDRGREIAELGNRVDTSKKALSMPAAARLDPNYVERRIERGNLGIRIEGSDREPFLVGRWLAIEEAPGIFVSLIAPEVIAPEILRSDRDRVNALDSKEATALVYAVAFDLKQFDLGFGIGTDNPGVEWSARVLPSMRDGALPGPDGIDSIRPLIASGMIPPSDMARTAATFADGYKRYHGAFKYGALALRNNGSHYGFIQEGVILSKLQPGLSTLYVLRDGSVHMQAWTDADNRQLADIRYARQNGVPLVEWDAQTNTARAGEFVNQWGAGNWSGSVEGNLRTVRGGACLQKTAETEYLIYAYFSNATPAAMARIFQAYGCRHAMQLDINAPILTYLALYAGSSSELHVQYLVQPMVEADPKIRGNAIPRFLMAPDNRDFFYLMRREGNRHE